MSPILTSVVIDITFNGKSDTGTASIIIIIIIGSIRQGNTKGLFVLSNSFGIPKGLSGIPVLDNYPRQLHSSSKKDGILVKEHILP